MKIFYIMGNYVSHHKTGLAYRQCIDSLGVDLVTRPEDADIVIVHDTYSHISNHFSAHPTLKSKYIIGYIVWETDFIPEVLHADIQLFDEIWTPSNYSYKAISKIHDRVFIIPHIVEKVTSDRMALEIFKHRIGYQHGAFYYYTIGHDQDPRKNISAIVDTIFPMICPGNVELIVKTTSGIKQPSNLPPGIHVITEMTYEPFISALHELCHCFVSAHCAEAWGLGMSEAMSWGNLVVATGFSGNMDFMTSENSLPVAYSLGSVGSHEYFSQWTPDMTWAHIDESDLKHKLQYSRENWTHLSSMRSRAKSNMKQFSQQKIATLLRTRLKAINFVENSA